MLKRQLLKRITAGDIYDYSQSRGGNEPGEYLEKYVDGVFSKTCFPSLSSSFNVRFFIVSQTEPHLLPFIFPRARVGYTTWRSLVVAWWQVLPLTAVFVKNHIMFMFKFMKDCSIIPYFFGEDFSSSMLQTTKGDITLSPPIFFSAYLKLFQDPSSVKDTEHVLSEGQKMVWKKLPMIRNRTKNKVVKVAIARVKQKRIHYSTICDVVPGKVMHERHELCKM